MGIIPKWVGELDIRDFWKGVVLDVTKIPSTVGTVIKDTTKPILSGARSALTPTIIWLIVIAVITLILFTYFKKAVKI